MQAATIIIAIWFLLLVVYCLHLRDFSKIKRHGKPLRRPPNTLPIAGNGILFLQARHKLFSWFVKCEHQFGFETFQISVPSLPPGVVINDPRNLEFVLKNEGIFAKGDFFRTRSWDLFGHGIINADGDLWRVQRKAGLHFLNNSNLKVLTDMALPKHIHQSVEVLQSCGEESIIDLESIFHELTTQIMGRMAYNMDMHADDSFSVSFEYASGKTGERFQNPLWQITELFFGKELRSSIVQVKKFGSSIVSTAVEHRKDKKAASSASEPINAVSGSLINSLLDSIDDEQIVADAALNYLSAGRDTTAQALTWAFYLLMRHPHSIKAIRNEVDRVVSAYLDENGSVPNRNSFNINPANFRPSVLPYVMAVFYETLRLYPPVPFELKQCEQQTTLPDGTFLPKNAILVWCTWAMNRSKLTWGEDAVEFKPERWLEDGNFVSKTAFEFPVFNGGPRTCLGKKMAELVAVQVISSLVLMFDFVAIDSKERISRNSLTLPMQGGLPCFVKPRPQI